MPGQTCVASPRRRRVLALALFAGGALAAGVVASAAQASWPGLNGWESFSSNRSGTAASGDIFTMPPLGGLRSG
jgi:hypothetical protein